eukprot:3611456-Pleurochrysis_carterae.AAC.2
MAAMSKDIDICTEDNFDLLITNLNEDIMFIKGEVMIFSKATICFRQIKKFEMHTYNLKPKRQRAQHPRNPYSATSDFSTLAANQRKMRNHLDKGKIRHPLDRSSLPQYCACMWGLSTSIPSPHNRVNTAAALNEPSAACRLATACSSGRRLAENSQGRHV